MKRKFMVIVCAFCFFAASGCSSETEETAVNEKAVTTLSVSAETYDEKLNYQGIVSSKESKNYSFLSGGKIENIYVSEGQFINAGDVLAKLNTDSLENKVLQSRSQYSISMATSDKNIENYATQIESKNTEIKNLKSEIEVQNKTIETIKTSVKAYEDSYAAEEKKLNTARDNTAKMKTLYDVGGIAESEYENALLEESSYEAELSKSKASLEEANANLASAEASLQSLENELETAESELISLQKLKEGEVRTKAATADVSNLDTESYKNDIDNSTIYADRSGYVETVNYKAGENVAANSPVVVINSEEAIVTIGVSLQDYGRINDIRKILINGTTEGSIDTIAKYPDETSGTYKVEISFNSDDINIGEIADVELLISQSEGVFIPKDSVININGVNYVYKLNNDNTVSRVRIEIEEITDDKMLVKNLSNEKIVVSGVQSLQENELVREINAE